MSSSDALPHHLQLCEELHQLSLEENKFIQEHQRPPDSRLTERRKALMERLDASLSLLKESATAAVPSDRDLREQRRDVIERSRTRILQILHLQKENEQLILRYSLGGPRPAVRLVAPPASHLQKIYDRHR